MNSREMQVTRTFSGASVTADEHPNGERLSPQFTPLDDQWERDVANEGAQRVGTLAMLTAGTVVGIALLQSCLQPELSAHRTPLFRLSALCLVAASGALAAAQRAELFSPRRLLDLGLCFEVMGALALGLLENAVHWSNAPLGRSTAVGGWIAIWVMVVPSRPWKSITAAFLSAAMLPAAHLVASRWLGYPAAAWNQLASYSMVAFFMAAWTPFISTRLHKMQQELRRVHELGSYQLETMLGRGGMGEVWRARHKLLRRDAAVKLVRPRTLTEPGSFEWRQVYRRFELEASAMATLRSPHTVALYDFGRADDGSLYYVMELLDGMDAEVLVDRYGPLPAGRVISILRQACESLEEAHDRGLVHRDVKPANIFLSRMGNRADFVKLLDFGLVLALHDNRETRITAQEASMGTPAFMSPEQARGERDIDARADLYSLGCVAFYLLTGTFVYKADSAISMAVAHIEATPEPPSQRAETPIPASLEGVVMRCLEKHRGNRPQSAAELDALLMACADVPEWTQAEARRWWAEHDPAAK